MAIGLQEPKAAEGNQKYIFLYVFSYPVVNLHGFFYRGFYPLLRLPL